MEEVHKAVLKGKRVHDDKIIPVPDKIRDHQRVPSLRSGTCGINLIQFKCYKVLHIMYML